MSTLLEIEAATETLPPDQKAELLRFLATRLHSDQPSSPRARLVHQGDDALLEAAPGAPPMTPENIRRMLEDWP
jgi:hypothetical protein